MTADVTGMRTGLSPASPNTDEPDTNAAEGAADLTAASGNASAAGASRGPAPTDSDFDVAVPTDLVAPAPQVDLQPAWRFSCEIAHSCVVQGGVEAVWKRGLVAWHAAPRKCVQADAVIPGPMQVSRDAC